MTALATQQGVRHIQSLIDWQATRREWDAMLDRHDRERAEFIRGLVQQGANQDEVADQLGVSRQRVGQWLDYDAVMKLATTVAIYHCHCGETFDKEVWHCPICAHHWPMTRDECFNCHRADRDGSPVAVIVDDIDEPTERELRPFIESAAAEVAAERGVERVRRDREEVHVRAAEKYAEATSKPHVAHNSGENEWYTPDDYLIAAREVMGGIDLDPASSAIAQKRVKAKRYYTKDDDGLVQEWSGRVWMNPPYDGALIGRFASKLVQHFGDGMVTEAAVLVNNATETAWFQSLASVASAICFPRGRVRFLDPEGNLGAPLQGQAVVYFGSNTDGFRKRFGQFGIVASL